MIRADPIMSKLKITFVLPGDHRSGGVRVTMLMANELLRRGIKVRIACPEDDVTIWKRAARRVKGLARPTQHVGRLDEFKGEVSCLEKTLDASQLHAQELQKELHLQQGEHILLQKELRAAREAGDAGRSACRPRGCP